MKRTALTVAVGALVIAPAASASDSTLKNALKPYSSKLTSDIAYLATFPTPSKSTAGSVSKHLSKIEKDLKGAQRAAQDNQASSSKGTTGRSEVLTGLGDAIKATADANASVAAARAGKKSTAKNDAKSARSEISKAVPVLEAGGKALGLFG
jgi:formate-dependent nitrite reductase cytochrome c552 subunit